VDDRLAACDVGQLFSLPRVSPDDGAKEAARLPGFTAELVGQQDGLIAKLPAGGSGGGVDVIGMWAARKFKNASVGKISLYVNVVVYASLLLMFDIEIVIYSLIYMVFFTLMMDRVHYQNITVRLMIFTKQEGIDQKILKQTGRGVTEWTGVGAYTKEETKIMICCINKFETAEFVEIIHSIDPKAFVIADEGVSVMSGNFEKRL